MKQYVPLELTEDRKKLSTIAEQLIQEITYKYSIRKGKKIKKAVVPKGYKIKRVHGRPVVVRQTSTERRKRSVIAKRSARKRKGKLKQALRKRRISMRKRTWSGAKKRRKGK